jgi:hypothetical protein
MGHLLIMRLIVKSVHLFYQKVEFGGIYGRLNGI